MVIHNGYLVEMCVVSSFVFVLFPQNGKTSNKTGMGVNVMVSNMSNTVGVL